MKPISLALHVTSLIAIGVLFVLLLNKPEKPAEKVSSAKVTAIADSVISAQDKKLSQVVAFINTDSIFSNYLMALDMKRELEAEERKIMNRLRKEEASVLKDYEDLQRKAPTMSQFEGRMKQQELMERQEELMGLEEQLSQKLITLEQEKNRELNLKIREFLEAYAKDKPYEVVLSYNEMGIIRWGDQRLDITTEVIDSLNAQYAQNAKQ